MSEQKILIDVSPVLSSDIGLTTSYSVNEKIASLASDVKPTSNIKGKVTLCAVDENIISAFINTSVEVILICSRCLKNYHHKITLNYEQIYSIHKEADTFLINRNQTIDIYPSIRQEILLSVPIKPICKDECKIIK